MGRVDRKKRMKIKTDFLIIKLPKRRGDFIVFRTYSWLRLLYLPTRFMYKQQMEK
jgi:hypothetical protein